MCGLLALPHAYAADASTYGLSGKIGNYPVAMQLQTDASGQIVQGHYSYASQQKTIPLTIQSQGDTLQLSEAGGGVFTLHYVGSGNPPAAAHDLYNAVGLTGTWQQGSKQLSASFQIEGGDQPGHSTPDCAYYPAKPAVPGKPHFTDGGCTHTPDQAVLDRCIAAPYQGRKAVQQCISAATKPCAEDQMDINRCVGNLGDYLEQSIQLRVQAGGSMSASQYQQWLNQQMQSCKNSSSFAPDGSGYGADVGMCVVEQQLGLLQRHLQTNAKSPAK